MPACSFRDESMPAHASYSSAWLSISKDSNLCAVVFAALCLAVSKHGRLELNASGGQAKGKRDRHQATCAQ
eukprot:scaffold209770_cov23-Tisochrysis_lutea.AAC.1